MNNIEIKVRFKSCRSKCPMHQLLTYLVWRTVLPQRIHLHHAPMAYCSSILWYTTQNDVLYHKLLLKRFGWQTRPWWPRNIEIIAMLCIQSVYCMGLKGNVFKTVILRLLKDWRHDDSRHHASCTITTLHCMQFQHRSPFTPWSHMLIVPGIRICQELTYVRELENRYVQANFNIIRRMYVQIVTSSSLCIDMHCFAFIFSTTI